MFAGRIVSIVDDDKSIREGLSNLLRSCEITSYSFASAAEILDSGRVHDSDCLIVDVGMPGMNGFELQDELVSRGIDTPVIFMSAHKNQIALRRVRVGQAVCFLEKPFSALDIERCLRLAFLR